MTVHYNDAIMSAMASQITRITIVYSSVYSGEEQRKHQSSASLAIVRGNYRSPASSQHKGLVMRKMFPFDDVIIWLPTRWSCWHAEPSFCRRWFCECSPKYILRLILSHSNRVNYWKACRTENEPTFTRKGTVYMYIYDKWYVKGFFSTKEEYVRAAAI